LIQVEIDEKHTAGAKARDFILHFSARLKSCPDTVLEDEKPVAKAALIASQRSGA
jgi:hypothetical protein